MTEQELRRITLEEYIEANGGMLSHLEDMARLAKENGLDWTPHLRAMMSDVEYKARFFRTTCKVFL